MRKKCPVCLKEYEARRDSTACSPRCKKRLQRAPSKEHILKEAFADAQSSMRTISMLLDDPVQMARATNMLRALIREFSGNLPAYMRGALGAEISESVSASEILDYRAKMGH